MNKVTVAICALCLAACSTAFAQNRPGLWQSTTTMTWDKMGLPPDMMERMKSMPNNPFAGTTVTVKSCITQEQVDKGMQPQNTPRQCQVTNFTKTSEGARADIVCNGQVQGNGSFESHRIDADNFKMHGHFAGHTARGGEAEWSMEGTSHFVSASCGTIEPGKSEVVRQ